MTDYKAHLIIRRIDGEEVKRVGLTSVNPRHIERVVSGMLINMNTDDFYIDTSEAYDAWAEGGKK